MHRKIIGSVLLGLCMFANSALAALPKEGVYEKLIHKLILKKLRKRRQIRLLMM